MELVIVTGMSGAGKSQAVRALEDIGFYCVDNMPPTLMQKFAELCDQSAEPIRRVALVMDVRGGRLFRDLEHNLRAMDAAGQPYQMLFLDCDDAVLCRRYKETRRKHPLVEEGETTETALQRERELLAPLALRADFRVDTTQLSTSQLKQQISALFLEEPAKAMTIHCLSFGFKYGFPAEADLMLDVRCFPNPYYVPELQYKTGLDREVREFVLKSEEAQGFLTRLYDLLDYLIPLDTGEGKSQLVIAVGCTGGKHRSVTMAMEIADHLRTGGHRVLLTHRDVEKR